MKAFPCTSCGACCRNVHLSEETQYLDKGNGICIHLNIENNLCSIYEERPDVCRVELQYQKHYKHVYSWEEFVTANLIACEQLNK